MAEPDRAELLRSMGRLARGLSMLFWGLPLTFMTEVETARPNAFGSLGPFAFAPSVILNGALLFGLLQLRHFQRQERIWQLALTRTEALALINLGLAPFVFWWRRFPDVPYYAMALGLLGLSSLLFLIQLNRALQRLAAMIPDEGLRAETNAFGSFNIWLLAAVFIVLSVAFAAVRFPQMGATVQHLMMALRVEVLIVAIVPLAVTMALLWKIKEVVFAGIFNHGR